MRFHRTDPRSIHLQPRFRPNSISAQRYRAGDCTLSVVVHSLARNMWNRLVGHLRGQGKSVGVLCVTHTLHRCDLDLFTSQFNDSVDHIQIGTGVGVIGGPVYRSRYPGRHI